MEAINRDIKDIKDAMLKHDKADDERFDAILNKLEIMHELHIKNGEMIKNCVSLGEKTNGRVTKLEDVSIRLDKGNALLHQIVSQQHNQYENYVTQQEKLGNGFITRTEFDPIKKTVYGGVSIILTAVVGSLMALLIINK